MSNESVPESIVDSAKNVLAAQQSGDPERLSEALLVHIEQTTEPERRRDSLVELGRVFEERLNDPARALPAYVAALAIDPAHVPTMEALTKQYSDRGDWLKAAQMMVRADEADVGGRSQVAHRSSR